MFYKFKVFKLILKPLMNLTYVVKDFKSKLQANVKEKVL